MYVCGGVYRVAPMSAKEISGCITCVLQVDEDGAPLSPLQRLLLKGTAGGGQPNLKHRVAGMLDREREDSDTP